MQGIIRRTIIDTVPVVLDEAIDTTLKDAGYDGGRTMCVGLYIAGAGNLVYVTHQNVTRTLVVTDFTDISLDCKRVTSATTAEDITILVGGM